MKYRVIADIDKNTNDFPRDKNGNINSSFDDLHIKCQFGNQIYSYGHGILVAYIPSLIRGHNIIKALKDIPFDIEETDSEVLFKFKYEHLDDAAKLLKAQLNRIDQDGNPHYISPFSSKNLPKSKFKIPDDKLNDYNNLKAKLGDKGMLFIKNINSKFMKKMSSRKNPLDSIKADMKQKGMKFKEYIYTIGKWDEYLSFFEKEIAKN